MVVEYSNKNMAYEKAFINGVVPTPPKIQYETQYHSIYDRILFDEIHNDIYQKIEKAPPPKKGEFPKVLKYALGIIGIGSVVLFGKDIFRGLKTFIKNFPK